MTDVEMIPVKSSNLDAVGYDANEQQLYVRFLSGGTYKYFGVSEYVFNQLLMADSKGQYLARYIKKAGYRYERLL